MRSYGKPAAAGVGRTNQRAVRRMVNGVAYPALPLPHHPVQCALLIAPYLTAGGVGGALAAIVNERAIFSALATAGRG
ncbi:MAG: hypothetical protein WC091_23295 [Sulfuricellaceae bacterium]